MPTTVAILNVLVVALAVWTVVFLGLGDVDWSLALRLIVWPSHYFLTVLLSVVSSVVYLP